VRTAHPVTAPPQRPRTAAGGPLGLEARLAARDAEMVVRLELAALTAAVDAAGAEEPVDLAEVITGPVTAPAPPADCSTPAAAALHGAARLLAADGWCRGTVRDDHHGAHCLEGAVRAAAATTIAADHALAVLLAVARRRWPDVETVPQANDQRVPDRAAAVQLLTTAAAAADHRGL
jgi:hypothetical protein